ncbi:Dyp-type peroxidase [Ottowia sp. GY511]|uniref:Dyp-type peroxidase n=1 Tax=Ottowia flava TaxID=2675430 RepID=A0ABW4KXN2_9BURK|nr:Dyp-type peroxidase [Ottowia sp. GY511]TXK22506.1 Dyp-type peroxidase [Ottowia sp. GY511]
MSDQGSSWDRVPIDAQSINAPLSRAAVFLVVTVNDTPAALAKACDALSSVGDLLKDVGFRDLTAHLSCVVGIGSDLWKRLGIAKRPAELKPFAAIQGAKHNAPATAGDVLFHIRADRADLVFEFERVLLDKLGDAVQVEDEVSGFRYFDARDLLGFVDGTANPDGSDLPAATQVGSEDPAFCGGSYVVVQKYLHDLTAWGQVPVEQQEKIIGRTKLDNVELDDDAWAQKTHKTLATIVDEKGVEHDILRDNMPFGRPGQQEFGTYFIGYSRRLWVTEKMLQRLFIGEPVGKYDRLLDFSTAKTGCTFFVPTRAMLGNLPQLATALAKKA